MKEILLKIFDSEINEYKTARKILLRNLTGNSAFRYEK